MIGYRPESDIAIGWSAPPYREFRYAPQTGGGGFERLPRGTVVVLDLRAPDDASARLAEVVAAVRARFPTAPAILRVPSVTADTVRLAQRAVRLHVRAIVGADEPLGEVLRPVLTRPDDLGEDVAEWMALRGRPLPAGLGGLVCHLVREAHRFVLLADLLAPLGQSGRTTRQQFRGHRLPPPSAWHQMGRALHCALRIQAQPEARLALLALQLGYSDPSGLSRQLTRAFGVTPVAVRGTLGWEWLVDRWLFRTERS
jgi:AraC-like DNA-binding protein